MKKTFIPGILLVVCLLLLSEVTQAQVFLSDTSGYMVQSIDGGATWIKDSRSGDFIYDNADTTSTHRAIMYSKDAYQSDVGFRLTIEYTTGSVGDTGGHNFSFGLISDETDLSTFAGFNPFRAETSVYSLGVNLTTDEDPVARGLNFTNGTQHVTLDESGTRVQFTTGATTKVYIEIGIGGSWQYRINDEYEASGVLLNGFDPAKSYHLVVYGQDDNGGGKSIQSITLEKAPAAGERANNLRGTWSSGINPTLIDDRLKRLKTLDGFGVGFTDGASLSAQQKAPHKLLESLPGGDAVVPPWGDLSFDEPENDPVMDQILKIKAAGFKVKAYVNSENFIGSNASQFEEFVQSWKNYCDTNTEVQAFINSQPYHTGIWNRTTQQYEDASGAYPNRKYMFCYAEYVLKDYALRYGKYIDSWIFDDGSTMEQNGDNATSGLIDEQRIYQAYSDAVHAGNPDIPVAFNNGRSTVSYAAFPYAHPIRFEDFTFGHAFGGNHDHASKEGGQFYSNYKYITRMIETNGHVFEGNDWDWDDLIVGNFHSKLSTTAWKYGPVQAWEQDDFNQWNLEAMRAGGSMTWDGSFNRSITAIYQWVYVMLESLDNYLAQYESPGAPNWARYHTILPDALVGEAYADTLFEGDDFWDPEGDEITALIVAEDASPSWLSIREAEPGEWVLSGSPDDTCTTEYEFRLQVKDASGENERKVHLKVIDPTEVIPVTKLQISKQQDTLYLGNSFKINTRIYPKDASTQSLSWSSSDSLVATVDANGIVTSVNTGRVTITATTADDSYSDSSAISVVIREVPKCEHANVALCGNATQSSVDYGGVPSRAIDGNTSGNFADNTVTHTLDEANPWWQVDLGREYTIGNIIIFNRAGKNANRLSNFTVFVYNANGVEVFSKAFTSYPNPSVTFSAGGVIGQRVKIQINGDGILSLAEVQVFEFVPVSGILVSPDSLSLKVGDTNLISATVLPADATNHSINWSSNDTTVATIDSTGLVTALNSGSVSIIATTLEGAYTSECTLTVEDSISTHLQVVEIAEKGLKLYPNPANNSLNFDLGDIEGTSIAVYSILGALIFKQEIKSPKGQIDISSLKRGVYLMKVQGGEIVVTRFIKE